jgi:hypothetical protein
MVCQKIRRSSFLFFLLLNTSFYAEAAERDDLYDLGRSAYEADDYVLALKNLYAFYVLNAESVGDNPSFQESIEAAIADCEVKLKLALASNKFVDAKNGKFILRSDEVDSGFILTGKQVEELINSNVINLEQMMERE